MNALPSINYQAACRVSKTNPSADLVCDRAFCRGEEPLDGHLETWMQATLTSSQLPHWLAEHGSPLNLLSIQPFVRNAEELRQVADARNLELRPFFARKANKCLAFLDQARECELGIDTASEMELQQSLDNGIAPSDLICTAAVKSESLVDLCIQHGVVVAIDSADELDLITTRSHHAGKRAVAALRLGSFQHESKELDTRFGFDVDREGPVLNAIDRTAIELTGIHFHLDGQDASQRVSAIKQSLSWIDRLSQMGCQSLFLDIGGGIPMSYVEDQTQWDRFREQLRRALLGQRCELTHQNHGLGYRVALGKDTAPCVTGKPNVYPPYQPLVRGEWLASILDTVVDGNTVHDSIRTRSLQLRCEPGRSLLDGCGLTVARVETCKQRASGDWLIGLSMNHTQCRTTSDDFLVDPIVVPVACQERPSSMLPMRGYFVGTYCTETDFISLRKFVFPYGVARGDLVVFPNTAGYLMHFMESRSHQFPLAKNLVVVGDDAPKLDLIDQASIDLVHG